MSSCAGVQRRVDCGDCREARGQADGVVRRHATRGYVARDASSWPARRTWPALRHSRVILSTRSIQRLSRARFATFSACQGVFGRCYCARSRVDALERGARDAGSEPFVNLIASRIVLSGRLARTRGADGFASEARSAEGSPPRHISAFSASDAPRYGCVRLSRRFMLCAGARS
jgi:hypothetical protein